MATQLLNKVEFTDRVHNRTDRLILKVVMTYSSSARKVRGWLHFRDRFNLAGLQQNRAVTVKLRLSANTTF